MLWRTLLGLVLAAASLAQSTYDVDVGPQYALVFSPNTLKAEPGSKVNFHFYPGDHSVAQSTFDSPCVPSGSDALYSGFLNPSSGVASMMWTITINNTDPLWLYCSQIVHCQSGMVMVINPPSSGDQTLAAYTKASAATSNTISPANVEGGVFSANKEGSSPSSGSGSGSGSGSTTPIVESPIIAKINRQRKAHGIIMALTVAILFPVGALWIRVLSFRGLVWFHAAWQTISLCLLTAGFGIGVVQAKTLGILFTGLGKTHTLFGTVLFAFFWIQPALGLAHHTLFKRKQRRTAVSYAHLVLGRVLLITAIINGGLGLKLVYDIGGPANTGGASGTSSLIVAYAVVAGVIGAVWIAGAVFGELRRARKVGEKSDG